MCSCLATSFIKPFFLSVLVRSQDYNVSEVKNIEKVKIVPAPKGSKFKNRKRNNGYVSMIMIILCQYSESDL